MGSASNVSVSEMVVRHPAAADGKVAHLTVEHGEGRWRMLDEYLQSFLALAQLSSICLRSVMSASTPIIRIGALVTRQFEIRG